MKSNTQSRKKGHGVLVGARRELPGTPFAGEARIGPLLALPRLLDELHVDPRRAFAQAGIAPRLFDDPENRLAHESVSRLLSVCAELSGRSDFGLMLGMQFTLADFGALGALMGNAATAGEALRMLLLHLHFYDRGAVPVMLRMGSSTVFLGYSLQHAAGPGAGQLQDVAIVIAHRMLRELCGPAWRPRVVQFSHRRPADIAAYRRVFGPGVHFDAELSGFSFDTTWLECAIAGADPARFGTLTQALHSAIAPGPMSVAEEVQCVLHQLLPGGTAAAASVARLFGISERTLRHRLQAEGTSLQRVLAETRFELARQLLQNTRLPMSQIATALCYADAAVFSRAFHGWTGTTPRQWRRDKH
jgi:AraC-like DNA-binding protein